MYFLALVGHDLTVQGKLTSRTFRETVRTYEFAVRLLPKPNAGSDRLPTFAAPKATVVVMLALHHRILLAGAEPASASGAEDRHDRRRAGSW